MGNIDWQNDSDKEIENKIKNTAFNHDMLMNSAYYGRVEIIKFMKKENYIDKEIINKNDVLSGYYPLHNAVLGGSAEAVETLIEFGADINQREAHKHATALHLAASLGYTQMIKNLVARGANVNATFDIGITPLHLAAYEGQIEAVKSLIELGADVNIQNENGETALQMAKRGGFPEIVKILIKNGASRKKRKSKTSSDKASALNKKKFGGIHLTLFALNKKAKEI